MGVVDVESLVVRYGDVVAVDGVTFTAEAGAVTAVLGSNGAGKTSTIEVCEGFRRATSGTVRVLGLDPATSQAKLSERMGVMLQDGGISPSARVEETIRHYCALHGRGVDGAELVELVGLGDRRSATWRRLSGGERQRVSLALALAARPDVAFLDEPTSGVDVHGRDTIRGVVRSLAANGCAVVLATHELDEAERVADRVVILDGGRVVADDTITTLRGGRERVRFRSAPDLEVDELAQALGFAVSTTGPGEYTIECGPQPMLMSLLAMWLQEHGHPLTDVHGGGESLEDVFRRLTGKAAR